MKDKFMTKNDVYKELTEKVKCPSSFDALTFEEISAVTNKRLLEILDEMYDISKEQISHLSERDTFVIRKLYGVLDNGNCATGLRIQEDLELANVGGIKANYLQRLNVDVGECLLKASINKKMMYLIKLTGVEDLNILIFNLVVFNNKSASIQSIEDFVRRSSIENIEETVKNTVIRVKNREELKDMGLSDRELKTVFDYYGLGNDGRGHTLLEMAEEQKVTRERIREILGKANRKVFIRTNPLLKSDFTELGLSTRVKYILQNNGITTIDELRVLSKDELKTILVSDSLVEEVISKVHPDGMPHL